MSIIDSEGLAVDVNDATWLCWSAMQGLVVLQEPIAGLNARKGGGELAVTDLVRRFSALIVAGMRSIERSDGPADPAQPTRPS